MKELRRELNKQKNGPELLITEDAEQNDAMNVEGDDKKATEDQSWLPSVQQDQTLV